MSSASPAGAITGISSMATRQILEVLGRDYEASAGLPVCITSIGGVDALRRVAAGDPLDVAILSATALATLQAGGHVVAGSVVPLLRSGVAVAVRSGAARPMLASEEDLKAAVLAATRIGYSTGPSGTYLMELFARWGITDAIGPCLVQAPPGVPVAALLARGDVDLGFQQTSELIGVDGVDIVGPMPPEVQIETVFAGAICTNAVRPDEARKLLAFLGSDAADAVAARFGMAVVRAAAPKTGGSSKGG